MPEQTLMPGELVVICGKPARRNLNKPRIQLWVDMLRSGKYKQCFLGLRSYDGCAMCVTGVAIQVWAEQTKADPEPAFYQRTFPPDEVIDWFGMRSEDMARLMGYNDSNRWSFERLAECLESWYLP